MHRTAVSTIDHLEADAGPHLIGNTLHATQASVIIITAQPNLPHRRGYSSRVVPATGSTQQNWLEDLSVRSFVGTDEGGRG